MLKTYIINGIKMTCLSSFAMLMLMNGNSVITL